MIMMDNFTTGNENCLSFSARLITYLAKIIFRLSVNRFASARRKKGGTIYKRKIRPPKIRGHSLIPLTVDSHFQHFAHLRRKQMVFVEIDRTRQQRGFHLHKFERVGRIQTFGPFKTTRRHQLLRYLAGGLKLICDTGTVPRRCIGNLHFKLNPLRIHRDG